jgi:hypothetical protein
MVIPLTLVWTVIRRKHITPDERYRKYLYIYFCSFLWTKRRGPLGIQSKYQTYSTELLCCHSRNQSHADEGKKGVDVNGPQGTDCNNASGIGWETYRS